MCQTFPKVLDEISTWYLHVYLTTPVGTWVNRSLVRPSGFPYIAAIQPIRQATRSRYNRGKGKYFQKIDTRASSVHSLSSKKIAASRPTVLVGQSPGNHMHHTGRSFVRLTCGHLLVLAAVGRPCDGVANLEDTQGIFPSKVAPPGHGYIIGRGLLGLSEPSRCGAGSAT